MSEGSISGGAADGRGSAGACDIEADSCRSKSPFVDGKDGAAEADMAHENAALEEERCFDDARTCGVASYIPCLRNLGSNNRQENLKSREEYYDAVAHGLPI